MTKDSLFKVGLGFMLIIVGLSVAGVLGLTDPYGTASVSMEIFLMTGSVVAGVGTVELAVTFYEGPTGDNRLAYLIGLSIPLLLAIGWWGGTEEVVESQVIDPSFGIVLMGIYFFSAYFWGFAQYN